MSFNKILKFSLLLISQSLLLLTNKHLIINLILSFFTIGFIIYIMFFTILMWYYSTQLLKCLKNIIYLE